MKAQIVGPGTDFIERQKLDAEVRSNLRRDKWVVRDNFHAERAATKRDLLTHSTQPEQAEHLAAHFDARELLLLPAAFLHGDIGGGQSAGERQDERQGVLRDADAVDPGGIHDDDAAGARGVDVDVVNPGAGSGDHPQARRRLDEIAIHASGASDDQRVRVVDGRDQRVAGSARAGVERPGLHFAESFERGLRQIIGDDDFHEMWVSVAFVCSMRGRRER